MSTESQPAGATDGDRERPYVVLKRGFFWRPNDQGYTSSINDAARYTEAEAKERCHGGEEPVTMALAVEYQVTDADMELATALSTYPEKRIEYARRIARHLAARLAPVESERDALRATVAKMREAFGKIHFEILAGYEHHKAIEVTHGNVSSRFRTAELEAEQALALVPADLADCVVCKREELNSLRASENELIAVKREMEGCFIDGDQPISFRVMTMRGWGELQVMLRKHTEAELTALRSQGDKL